jgi:hypothetical protein
VGDADSDGQITVDEILTAVNNALNSCQPQRSEGRTSLSTPLFDPSPAYGHALVGENEARSSNSLTI